MWLEDYRLACRAGGAVSDDFVIRNLPMFLADLARTWLEGVQKVIGCLAVLGRFISCLGERRLPLYWLLKKTDQFMWTPEAQEAFDKLKVLLTKALILVSSAEGEPLLLYVAATTQVVSAALVVEQEEEGHALKVQRPMYFISEVLSDSKTCCP